MFNLVTLNKYIICFLLGGGGHRGDEVPLSGNEWDIDIWVGDEVPLKEGVWGNYVPPRG
jgi:hypothetical protein